MYEYTINYQGRGKPGESPLDEPPIIEFDYVVSEESIDVDVNGKPLATVLGESFDPPLRRPVHDQHLRVSRNLAWVDPDLMSTYADAVNSDEFIGLPPGTCCVTEPAKANSVNTPDLIYFKCTIGVTIRRGVPGLYEDDKAWYRRVLAQGLYIAVLSNVDPDNPTFETVHARDSDGNKVSKPVWHDKDTGQRIPDGKIPGSPDPTLAEWYEFEIFRSLPFSALQVAD